MTHPFAEHRQHKKEHSRVAHITRGYASGGAVHGDEAEDRALIRKEVKRSALKAEGHKPKHRSDKPHRARGGRTKKGGKTVVNVIAGGGHPSMAAAAPAPMPAPMGPMAGPAPALPPRPPMPGGPPMAPGMPPRRSGGRAYKAGGRVSDGPSYKEGIRNGTQVQHSDGKSDGKDIGRKRVVTFKAGGRIVNFRAAGGKVEASNKVEPATKLPGGSGGGEGRLAKERRAARDYKTELSPSAK